MCRLAVSLLELDYRNLGKELERVQAAGVDMLHIDVMDGSFVPNFGLGPRLIEGLRAATDLPFDVHMMVWTPERYLERMVRAGADVITVHWEACQDTVIVLRRIHELGVKAGVVLKPETAVEVLDKEVLQEADVVQLMTTEPGMEGQSFIPKSLERLRTLRHRLQVLGMTDSEIEVDGNITQENIGRAATAGATIFVSGRALVQGDIKENVRQMRAALENGGYQDELCNRH